jgi:hypothetical protein
MPEIERKEDDDTGKVLVSVQSTGYAVVFKIANHWFYNGSCNFISIVDDHF